VKKQIETLTEQVGQHQRAAQFWYEKATAGASPTAAPAAMPEAEAEPDILDLLTTKGAKGLDDLLAQRGYVRKDEVEARIEDRVQRVSTEAQMIREYPELADTNGEFFKATALHYGQLKKGGMPEKLAMQSAVEHTALEFIKGGKMKTPAQRSADEAATRETDRQARARAQAGDPGTRTAGGHPEDDELTPEQKAIAVKMLAGEGVTPEEAVERYKKRAKQGVAIKGGFR
jgi:hypothetical protein